jgi:kanamycin kinase
VSVPSEPMAVPEPVDRIAARRPVAAVWEHELGGVTFAIDDGAEFVKVSPPKWAHHLMAEAERLAWAARYVVVPHVLGTGDGPPQAGGAPRLLHTAGLPGRSAVDPHWVADPRAAARAIGAGLRLLHDSLPVDDCPFGAPPWVSAPMPIDRVVVCHGDACAPNTLIDDDGRCYGHVDLGDLGVADRWADLAVATLSLSWNYGGSWEAWGHLPLAGDCSTRTASSRTRRASSTTGGCGTPATSRPAKLDSAQPSGRRGVCAGHERGTRRFPDRHQGRKHPV